MGGNISLFLSFFCDSISIIFCMIEMSHFSIQMNTPVYPRPSTRQFIKVVVGFRFFICCLTFNGDRFIFSMWIKKIKTKKWNKINYVDQTNYHDQMMMSFHVRQTLQHEKLKTKSVIFFFVCFFPFFDPFEREKSRFCRLPRVQMKCWCKGGCCQRWNRGEAEWIFYYSIHLNGYNFPPLPRENDVRGCV